MSKFNIGKDLEMTTTLTDNIKSVEFDWILSSIRIRGKSAIQELKKIEQLTENTPLTVIKMQGDEEVHIFLHVDDNFRESLNLLASIS